MVSKFHDQLHPMDPATEAPVGGLRAGPCGAGPVADGGTIHSMQIWLYQSRSDGTVAMSSGRSGEDARSPRETPPYEGVPVDRGEWMIRTGLDKNSGEFTIDDPVQAVALAI